MGTQEDWKVAQTEYRPAVVFSWLVKPEINKTIHIQGVSKRIIWFQKARYFKICIVGSCLLSMLFVQAEMLLRSLSIVHNNCKLNNGILLINNCICGVSKSKRCAGCPPSLFIFGWCFCLMFYSSTATGTEWIYQLSCDSI